jgi:hypothetical protein
MFEEFSLSPIHQFILIFAAQVRVEVTPKGRIRASPVAGGTAGPGAGAGAGPDGAGAGSSGRNRLVGPKDELRLEPASRIKVRQECLLGSERGMVEDWKAGRQAETEEWGEMEDSKARSAVGLRVVQVPLLQPHQGPTEAETYVPKTHSHRALASSTPSRRAGHE